MKKKMTIIVQKIGMDFSLVLRQSDFLGHSYPTTHAFQPLSGCYSGENEFIPNRNSLLKIALYRMFDFDLLTIFAKSISRMW